MKGNEVTVNVLPFLSGLTSMRVGRFGAVAHISATNGLLMVIFKEIWESEKRLKSVRWTEEALDTSQCRVNCRMDEINRYLWQLRHPPEHVNFI